jgi:hypothetical protein
MGKQHGRIIQIVVAHGHVSIQYSVLWSFEAAQIAPVENFIRYLISQPVGIRRLRSDSGLRINPVTRTPL